MSTRATKELINKKVQAEVSKVESKKNQEIEVISTERDHLQSLLFKVLDNQKSSKWKDWINIICWIICMYVLISEKL